jgi:hypothetical protein
LGRRIRRFVIAVSMNSADRTCKSSLRRCAGAPVGALPAGWTCTGWHAGVTRHPRPPSQLQGRASTALWLS